MTPKQFSYFKEMKNTLYLGRRINFYDAKFLIDLNLVDEFLEFVDEQDDLAPNAKTKITEFIEDCLSELTDNID